MPSQSTRAARRSRGRGAERDKAGALDKGAADVEHEVLNTKKHILLQGMLDVVMLNVILLNAVFCSLLLLVTIHHIP